MADEDGPRRLKRCRETSPALSRALFRLQRGQDDGARLQRVAAGLGPLLDMPLEAASGGVRRSGPVPRAPRVSGTVYSCVAGGLALLAPLVWFAQGAPPQSLSPRNVGVRVPSGALIEAPDARAPSELPASPLPLTAADARPPGGVPLPAAEPRSVRLRHRASPPSAAESSPARSELSRRKRTPQLAARTQLPAFEAPQLAGSEVAAAEPATQAAGSERTVAELAPVDESAAAESGKPSETELLLRARQALRSDPQGALRLVREHELRFPAGELVPEREVLAIEVLRGLGMREAAAARLQQFRARYPHSFYLDRLSR